MPLLYRGEELVCAPGVAIAADAAEYQYVADEAGISAVVCADPVRDGLGPDAAKAQW